MHTAAPICGIASLDGGNLDPKIVSRLGTALPRSECVHRGSLAITGATVWQDGHCAVTLSGSASIVYRQRPVDEQELANAFREWGDRVFLHMAGDFACAIWDGANRKLILGRDATGARPFYYSLHRGLLVFASELDTLFAVAELRREPDETTIGLHLANRIFDPEATLFKNVRQLAPGQFMTVEDCKCVVTQYWNLPAQPKPDLETDEEHAQQFLSLLRGAIDDRLTSRQANGLLLSGGLDSSAIACVAKSAGRCLHAYSVVSRTESFDESEYSRAVAAQTCANFTEIQYEAEVAPTLSLRSWDSVDVLYSPAMRFFEALFRSAVRKGQTTLLTGFGGDELFASGFGHLTDFARAGSVFRLWKQAGSDANVWGMTRSRLLWDYAVRPLLPSRPRRISGGARRGRTTRHPEFIRTQFLETSGATEFIESQKAPESLSSDQSQICWALRYGWNIVSQLEQIEILARQHGVELRHPFLDRRMVEFAISLPDNQRHRGQADRYVLRNAMRGLMPEQVRSRVGKSDLAGIIDRELRNNQVGEVRELLRSSRLAELGAVDPRALVPAFETFVGGAKAVHASEFETVIALELWLRNLARR